MPRATYESRFQALTNLNVSKDKMLMLMSEQLPYLVNGNKLMHSFENKAAGPKENEKHRGEKNERANRNKSQVSCFSSSKH